MKVKSLMTVTSTTTVGETPEHEEDYDHMNWAWDDANNKALNPTMVKKAREEEMKYIHSKNVLGEDVEGGGGEAGVQDSRDAVDRHR